MNTNLLFQPLTFNDLPLIHRWFNFPHVQQFYSLRHWTEQEVITKLSPYILGEIPVKAFVVNFTGHPLAYIQCYRISDFPWPGQDLLPEIVSAAAGMDVFIDEPNYLNKGLGCKIIQQFIIEKIWPDFIACVVDPVIDNLIAIHCYKKIGFKPHKIIHTTNALKQAIQSKLMILRKPPS